MKIINVPRNVLIRIIVQVARGLGMGTANCGLMQGLAVIETPLYQPS